MKTFLKVVGIGFLGIIGLLVVLALVSQNGSVGTRNSVRTVGEASAPTRSIVQEKSDADYLDPRLLASDPNGHKGENIFIQGEALNIEQQSDYTWINLQATVRGKSGTESIVVELRPPVKTLLSDECYRFYGIVGGTTSVVRLLTGATNDAPLVQAYAFEPSRPAEFFGCEAP